MTPRERGPQLARTAVPATEAPRERGPQLARTAVPATAAPQTGIDLLARADALRAGRIPFVLATVVTAQAPTSARPGDRALVFSDGTVEGFAGGACTVTTLRAQSAALLSRGAAATTLLRIVPGPGRPAAVPDPAEPDRVVVDNPCLSGGQLELFLEAVVPPVLVQVYGQSPIAQALVTVGAAAGYEVQPLPSPTAPVAPDAAAVVVASHGHDEFPVLRTALAAGTPYVALVASPKRGSAVLAELQLAPEQAARLKTPAGLDLGARTPGEVAVSILAELINLRGALPPAGPPEGVAAASPTRPAAQLAASSAPAAVDPVCGMSVAVTAQALRYEHAGRSWYFCAPGCRDAFVADPVRYAAAAGGSRGHS